MSVDEELRRVVPVIEALAGQVRVSVDTTKEAVAEAAVEAGATLINDVSASLWPVAARRGVGWVAMHRRGRPADHAARSPLRRRGRRGARLAGRPGRCGPAAGVGEVWIDPGIGFGKTVEHNLGLLAPLGELVATGFPVMVGTSRKSFLGRLAAAAGGRPPAVDERLAGSLATATWAMAAGAGMVRVHDVTPTVQAAVLVGRRRVPGRGMSGAEVAAMKGKWAAGIPPRNFTWVIKDRLAMSERPGRFRPQPPQGAAPGGDHLAPGPGVHPGRLAAAVLPQPAGLRGEVDGQRALPPAARRAMRGPSWPTLPGAARSAGRR